jgi:hypothetical protein
MRRSSKGRRRAGYTGGCLCGNIRYRAAGQPTNPHFCSCRMGQRWSGAPVVAWVCLPRQSVTFDGPGGDPVLFRSLKASRRGFCPRCGGTVCSVDDGSDMLCMTIATLDDPEALVPTSRSCPDSAPSWLRVEAVTADKRR